MSEYVKYWTTKDKRKIKVSDMTYVHLTNAIKFLERMHQCLLEDAPMPHFNGEMAQFYADKEWVSLMESTPEAIYPELIALKEELRKRKVRY